VTDDSQGVPRGDGSVQDEAERTVQIARQGEGARPAQTAGYHTASPAGADVPAEPATPAYPNYAGATAGDDTQGHQYGPFHTSGAPPTDPYYGPTSGAGPISSAGPTSGGAGFYDGPSEQYGFEAAPTWNRPRIEPSPPPDRGRLIVGILAGLVTGLVIFGLTGWFIGRSTAPRAAPPAAPAPSRQLGVYEQSQLAIAQPRFAGTSLTAISQGWLPYLANCARSGDPGGPSLNAEEKVRIRCTLDGMSMIFVEYHSIAGRDKARVKALGQNVDARTLTPGVEAAAAKATRSGRTNGNYVEYAYRLTEGGRPRTIAGVWWDDAPTPVAAYVLAYWTEGAGESWAPLRDLWARYA